MNTGRQIIPKEFIVLAVTVLKIHGREVFFYRVASLMAYKYSRRIIVLFLVSHCIKVYNIHSIQNIHNSTIATDFRASFKYTGTATSQHMCYRSSFGGKVSMAHACLPSTTPHTSALYSCSYRAPRYLSNFFLQFWVSSESISRSLLAL